MSGSEREPEEPDEKNEQESKMFWNKRLMTSRADLESEQEIQEGLAQELANLDRQREHILLQKEASTKRVNELQDKIHTAELKVPCQWNTMYWKLLKYKEENGHTNVPYVKKKPGTPEDDETQEMIRLGRFVGNQRVFYKYYQNGDTQHIKKHRIAALERIGFVWDAKQKQWDDQIALLKGFVDKHGHSYVPKTPEHSRLRGFVETQRTQWTKYRRGQPSTLREERIRDLNRIGFDWDRPPPSVDPAHRNLTSVHDEPKEKTTTPKRAKKTTTTTTPTDETGDANGDEKKPPTISNRLINSKLSREEFWEWKFKKLQEFHEEHGHIKVNKRDLPTEAKRFITKHELIPWVAQQRMQEEYMRDGKEGDQCWMTPEKKERLGQMGMIWKMPPDIKRKSGGGNKRKRRSSTTTETKETENNGILVENVPAAAKRSPENDDRDEDKKQLSTVAQIGMDKPLMETLSQIAKDDPGDEDEVLQAMIL